MNYSEFKNSIEKGKINPIYIITGEETYLLDKALERIIQTFMTVDQRTINLFNIDGKISGVEDLKASCETLPFMSQRRITVLRSPEYLVEKETEAAELLEYIKTLGDHQLLVINDRENKIKKNTKLFRYLSKIGSSVLFQRIKGRELSEWIISQLKNNGKDISYSNLNYFIQQSSYSSRNININLYDLENEIKKLCNFSTEKTINKTTLDMVLVKPLDKNIFDFLDAVGRKDPDGAMGVFNEIYQMNEPVPKILFMISRQFRLLLGYIVYKNKGYNTAEIQDKLKIKPYEFSKISAQGNQTNPKRIRAILEDVLETDKRLKTISTDQRLEMEMLIIRLTCN